MMDERIQNGYVDGLRDWRQDERQSEHDDLKYHPS